MLRRLHRPVEVSEATLAADAIAAVGPGRQLPRRTRTPRSASAPASTTCRRSRTGSPTRSGSEDGVTEYDDACAQVERILAAHAAKAPYLDGAQLDELAAICRVDDESDAPRPPRAERRGAHQTKHPNGGPHDAQDRLHRARRPRQAPRRQPAARRLPAHRLRRRRELLRRPRQGGRHLRRLHRRDGARLRHDHHLPAVARGGRLGRRRGGRRPRGARPRRHLDRHEHQRRARAAAPRGARRGQGASRRSRRRSPAACTAPPPA